MACDVADANGKHPTSLRKFGLNDINANSQTVALPSPSNDTRLLVKTALWILKRLYQPGYAYQKAGVLLNDLVPAEGVQRDLFFDRPVQSVNVMAVLDATNQRYGRQTVKLGSEGFKEDNTRNGIFRKLSQLNPLRKITLEPAFHQGKIVVHL